ncbi:hypothetical protein [Sorangium sp. So ce381]|uniref:hypothetical protein n=1 Tax=Sorangium sp. So ce381 TaxID=3133307 RepID=UPI003F5B84C4
MPDEHAIAAQRAMLHVNWVFGFVTLFVPKRLVDEEIGDALELMAKHFRYSRLLWPIYVKLASTVFWMAINAIRYLFASFKASMAEASRKAE